MDFSNNKNEEFEHEVSMISLSLLIPLKEYMDMEGISRFELANRMGISEDYILDVFTGDRLVTMELLCQFEMAIGIQFWGKFHFHTRYIGATELETYNKSYFFAKPKWQPVKNGLHGERYRCQYGSLYVTERPDIISGGKWSFWSRCPIHIEASADTKEDAMKKVEEELDRAFQSISDMDEDK